MKYWYFAWIPWSTKENVYLHGNLMGYKTGTPRLQNSPTMISADLAKSAIDRGDKRQSVTDENDAQTLFDVVE